VTSFKKAATENTPAVVIVFLANAAAAGAAAEGLLLNAAKL